ncbi:uncharacterized protein [Coffea arabica]|uniref:Zinc finger MYM-type protein 1-like n=1 Tax=Coffea arabica TaxID=13443 RepID=A0ABM4VKA6_COFAR
MERFNEHIGAVNSCHNDARIQFESFQDQRHSVSNVLRSCGREIDIAYRTRLTAALDVTRFLLKQGLAFRGNDESTSSSNRGNFLELFEWYSQRNTEIFEVVNQNALANNQLTSPMIQKDLAHACASEITSVIINDIGDNYFSLIVDESRDSSVKEQMGVVLRYVNKEGRVIERFLAIVHVSDTTSLCLKDAIDSLFAQHGLSLSKLRGQGYDGASNMRDFREEGWQIILDEVNNFCELNMIPVIDMEDSIAIRGNARRSRRGQTITNFHHYRVEIFCEVVDLIIQEMNNRFSEVSTELLSCIACLDPKSSFSQFNVQKLLRLADLYPEDFSSNDYLYLESQLRNYIYNVQRDPQFSEVGDLGSLAQQMVKTGKNTVFPLVYRLIQLALVLPVATASVERVFSAMNIVKTDLRNKMGDEWMNDCLVVYIEKDIFATIENEQILQRFQRMKTRRMQLPPLRYSSATTTTTSSVNQ